MDGLAELHTHLGGSVSSDILWTLAHEQGIALPVKDYWDFERLVTVSDPRGVPDLTPQLAKFKRLGAGAIVGEVYGTAAPVYFRQWNELRVPALIAHMGTSAAADNFVAEHGAEMEALDSVHRGTPLRWAAGDERWDVAKFLRSRGAKVEDIYMATALGDLKLVKEFLEKEPKLLLAA